ncbi:MAG: hypothetical protein ACLTJG_10975 [[Clostridium] innocuum]
MLRSILQPFIIGFVLAYVMHPLVEFLKRRESRRIFPLSPYGYACWFF